MTVSTTCKNFCRELRKIGIEEEGMMSVIPESLMNATAVVLRWSDQTRQRYLGRSGNLVRFGYLVIVEGGYGLTGEDLNG